MIDTHGSWLQKNWIALFAVLCFLMVLLKAWHWYVFRRQDDVIDIFFDGFAGIAFFLVHRNRKNEKEVGETLKQMTRVLQGKE
ncbi:MAG: hypothetical protein ACLPLR_12160 [Terriglobales bacterium]